MKSVQDSHFGAVGLVIGSRVNEKIFRTLIIIVLIASGIQQLPLYPCMLLLSGRDTIDKNFESTGWGGESLRVKRGWSNLRLCQNGLWPAIGS